MACLETLLAENFLCKKNMAAHVRFAKFHLNE